MERYIDRFPFTCIGGFFERHHIAHIEVVSKTLPVFQGTVFFPDRACAFGDALVLVEFIFRQGNNKSVVFSWIVFESREHRDKVNAAVMADPRIKEICAQDSEPFDCKRMVYGGFKKLVQM